MCIEILLILGEWPQAFVANDILKKLRLTQEQLATKYKQRYIQK